MYTSPLGPISIETFLAEYWQKKPLLIKQGISDIPVIPSEELAGFTLEEEVESRILQEHQPTNGDRLKSQWTLHHGPMDESLFATLPENDWTLLVQAVDQLMPEMHKLRQRFNFIPNWRIDDVMVSYAVPGGNVGPHFDYYDVFLIQATGQRTWQIGQHCNSQSALRDDCQCKVLKQFQCEEQWTVSPGDILYLPPGVAHWGIADTECTTYSVGFRAPSHGEILLDVAQELASSVSSDARFNDPDLRVRGNPGQIQQKDIQKIQDYLSQLANNSEFLAQWFGQYMTQAKRDTLAYTPTDDCPPLHPGARLAYWNNTADSLTVTLFANGDRLQCTQELAKAVCSGTLHRHTLYSHFPNESDTLEKLDALGIFNEPETDEGQL